MKRMPAALSIFILIVCLSCNSIIASAASNPPQNLNELIDELKENPGQTQETTDTTVTIPVNGYIVPSNNPSPLPGNGGGSGGGNSTPSPTPKPPVELEKDKHNSYVHGYPDGTFKAENFITRAEAAQIFYNLAIHKTDGKRFSSFKDVEQGTWYYTAVVYLADKGILSGYTDGSFHPEQPITRAEFVTIISKFQAISSVKTSVFTDVSMNDWAYVYINNVFSHGWISGYPDGSFKPEQNITRAEAVTITNHVLDRRAKEKDIPAVAIYFSDVARNHWAYAQIVEASTTHNYTRTDDSYEIWHGLD